MRRLRAALFAASLPGAALLSAAALAAPLTPQPAWHPAVLDLPSPGGGSLSPHGDRGIERDVVGRVAAWLAR